MCIRDSANRVDLIREASAPSQWGHVRTACNPADVCSRGTSVKAFLDSEKWIKGPKFLWRDESKWYEKDIGQFTLKNTDPELKCVLATEVKPVDPLSRAIERCSSWSKLKRSIAWIMVGMQNLQMRVVVRKRRLPEGQKQHGNLSVQDMRRAEEALVRFVQKEHWPNDIASLHKKSSSLRRLNPVIKNKLLCVGGRLQRENIYVMSKHQVLLPRNSHVSRLILRDIHETNGHLGKNHILAKLRQQYWIVGAPSLIKQITSKCVVCRRYQPIVGQQKMADLPIERVRVRNPLFHDTGMDYFGPFEVKRGRTTVKRYGMLFTCMASRAVHLEVAHTLDTASCINTIKRFTARRGNVSSIRSDNGTNLVGAERELRESLHKCNQQGCK
ncbi:uncharacterized protein LOC117106155 [Anneissia japonica]|uniref:uncharacterized protein LOC117106155 n=1 Tax=Anneissia japonica TaxID=1529436 RepID=UPI0014259806|nr:uncharacterized protein LOC117106155 [Anneissia japonica]